MAVGKYKEWLTKDGLLKLEAWARDGLTDEQIAHNMGISMATLYNYKKEYLDISEALKRGKTVADIEVENALYKRAIGFTYTETKTEIGDFGEKKVTKTVKTALPDTTAQIFWLKNRKPKAWRDKRDVEHSGGVAVNNPFAGLTTEELRKLIDDE